MIYLCVLLLILDGITLYAAAVPQTWLKKRLYKYRTCCLRDLSWSEYIKYKTGQSSVFETTYLFDDMVPGKLIPISRSNSLSVIPNAYCTHNTRGVNTNTALYLTMGPVTTSLVLFVAEKAFTRAFKGQLLRKGVLRKMKRLAHMILDWGILCEVLSDVLEDLQ